jgi:hypothetical protein
MKVNSALDNSNYLFQHYHMHQHTQESGLDAGL